MQRPESVDDVVAGIHDLIERGEVARCGLLFILDDYEDMRTQLEAIIAERLRMMQASAGTGAA